jgi:hypothetical protein
VLPRRVAVRWHRRPEQDDGTRIHDELAHSSCDRRSVKAMESRAYCNEFEPSIDRWRLRGTDEPANTGRAEACRLRGGERDGLRLSVDRDGLAKGSAQWKGDLTGAARQIKEPPFATDRDACLKVSEEGFRVRRPETVVIGSSALIQIWTELRRGNFTHTHILHDQLSRRDPDAPFVDGSSDL